MPRILRARVVQAGMLSKNESYLPIYRAVQKDIMDRIASGEWPEGTILPAEVALAHEFKVSVGTIRRALGELTVEGILARRRKTGTVVTGRSPQQNLRFFYSYFRLHSREGALQHSTVKILSMERRLPTESEMQSLRISTDVQVIHIHRLRYVTDRPVMHEHVVIPTVRVPDFPEKIESVPAKLYSLLWQNYDIKISAIREQLEADLATKEDADLLNLALPYAILVLQEVAYDEKAQPVLINCHRATTRDDIYINEIQ